MNHNKILKTTLAALFLALAYVMPFLTMQIPTFGQMLCPMHIPVLLCGFICGWEWGLIVGFIAPILRSFALGMPLMFPTAFCMAFELAAYGLVAGILYKKLPKKKINIYLSLLTAMVAGRVVFGIVKTACLMEGGGVYTFALFIADAITGSIPGIIIQIILVPVIIMAIEKFKPIKE